MDGTDNILAFVLFDILRISYPVAPHQQAARIHPVGRAGHQCDQVLSGQNVQILRVVRLHLKDLVHLIGKDAVQHVDIEVVPGTQQVQIGEQCGGGQSPVSGEHAMGIRTAHRKRGALQVSHAPLQDLLAGPVVDRQVD